MKFVIFSVILSLDLLDRTSAAQIGHCVYDQDEGAIAFICSKSKDDSEQIHLLDMICLNNLTFEKDQITKISFLNCEINQLPNHAFDAFENLTEIDVSDLGLTTLQPELFIGLPNLEKIIAVDNLLTSSLSFTYLANLKVLDLSSNPIEYIPTTLFQHLPNLERLNLADTSLKHFSINAFINQEQLREIDLSDNLLKEFDLNAFSSQSLIEVNLNMNRLSKLFPSSKLRFPNLKTLSIVHNGFDCKYLQYFLDEGNWTDLHLSNEVNSNSIESINWIGRPICR